ncbi:hypothetical protein CEXT_336091 [Caerostris extrusa]|uniref:Uncharacterized protein n=1 Tax=Caerostris extrusa TaxID=172846 RepID=A0AAV4MID7_CAEEX|nr:hypothetical protein CEXT_336091 [Caerostris extrusa]
MKWMLEAKPKIKIHKPNLFMPEMYIKIAEKSFHCVKMSDWRAQTACFCPSENIYSKFTNHLLLSENIYNFSGMDGCIALDCRVLYHTIGGNARINSSENTPEVQARTVGNPTSSFSEMTERAVLSENRLQIILDRPLGHPSRGINRGIHLSTRITRMEWCIHPEHTKAMASVADGTDTCVSDSFLSSLCADSCFSNYNNGNYARTSN